eukprot:TRINITY_DN4414_c0_g3_i3.p1 TRINITY_DN4414_c0_g3~~TRINITY_DN4414_c0_g3_i3.p1  ORF type:complete len:114 (-),score=19.24 TRINITY_DN4414_c0_g3_i3:854-1195(-)
MLAGLVLNEAEIKKRASKITLVGCGAVGMACVYSILSREVVGQVVIVDVDKKKLRGEVMDLRHAGGFLHADVIAAEDDFSGKLFYYKLVDLCRHRKQRYYYHHCGCQTEGRRK